MTPNKTRYSNFNRVGNNLQPVPHQPAVDVHFPRFGRPSHATHTTAPITGHATGIPDCLLFKDRINGNQNMCGEVKTYWAYTDDLTYHAMFRPEVANGITGSFDWDTPREKAAKLVKQVRTPRCRPSRD